MHNRKKIRSKKFSIRLWENWGYGTQDFEKLFWVSFPDQKIEIIDGFGTWYVDKIQLKSSMDTILDKIYKEWFEHIFEDQGVQIMDNFLSYCKSFKNIDFTTYSNVDLLGTLQSFFEKEDLRMHYMWIVFLLDEVLTKTLQEELHKRYDIDEQSSIVGTILHQNKKTYAWQHKIDLLYLMVDYEDKKISQKEYEESLRLLSEKYSFFTILNMDEDPLEVDYFTKFADSIYKQGTAKEQLQNLQKQYEQWEKDLKKIFSKWEHDVHFSRLLYACNKVWFYREWRNDIRQESYAYARILYTQIAKRMGLSIDQVIYITRDEIIEYLSTNRLWQDTETISQRKKYSLLEVNDNKITYAFSMSDSLEINQPEENIQIQWTVAYKWYAKGKVCIVRNITEDKDKFVKWDILVATTTNLAFIPLITQASAIITDEGWLLSHTAIVARELKLPCIVGTRNATTLLKDWDVIEVDANAWQIKKNHYST